MKRATPRSPCFCLREVTWRASERGCWLWVQSESAPRGVGFRQRWIKGPRRWRQLAPRWQRALTPFFEDIWHLRSLGKSVWQCLCVGVPSAPPRTPQDRQQHPQAGSHIDLHGLGMQPRISLNFSSSSLYLLRARITGHHTHSDQF